MSSVPFLEQAALTGWQQGNARKDQLADEELKTKADPLLAARGNSITKLSTLTKGTPEYDAELKNLTQIQDGIGELFHPIKAPGALQRNAHWLMSKLHPAPKDNTPSSITTQTPAMTLDTPTAPLVTPELPAYQQTTPALPSQGGAKTENVPGVAATTGPGMTNVPKGATPTMAVAKPQGLVEAGNIPIWNRPSILNADGTHSSELSISMKDDKGNEVLIPLIVDGKFLTPDGKMPPGPIPQNAAEWEKASPEWKALRMRAWQHYEQTGQHLGKFDNADDTDAYAQVLHNRGNPSATTVPAGPPVTVNKAPAPSWGQAQLLKKQAAAMQKAQQEAGLLAAGAPLSPQATAMAKFHADEAVNQAQIDATLATAERLGITGPALDELKQQLVGIKNITPKPLTGAAGAPYKGEDGLYRQAVSNPDGTVGFRFMPPDWKPNTKAVRGTLLNTKKYGFIQTWVDPFNPSKIIGWQRATPSRYYQGTTTSSSSTDPFGLTTTSQHTTTPTNITPVDIDLSGMQEFPDNFNGEDIPTTAPTSQGVPTSAAPSGSTAPTTTPLKSVTTPAAKPSELRKRVPAPPQTSPTTLPLDETGHIPPNAPYNANLIGAANNILDGMDVSKLPIPQKAREAAQNLARAYGWGGQGMFTPREALQVKEGASFLNMMANSPALKVLDKGFFSNIPMTGASPDPVKEGFFGRMMTNLASRSQTPEQQKFMDLYRQLDAMAVGLRALVQSGRGTQKQTDLLISELPNPYNTPSSEDARRRLQLVQKELEIAAKTGKLPPAEDMQEDFNSLAKPSNPTGGLTADDFRKKHLSH